jgi:hypothetical protein
LRLRFRRGRSGRSGAFVYDHATTTRYHEPRGQYRKTSYGLFQRDLGWMLSDDCVEVTEGEDIPWLTEDEFRQKYRVSKHSFQELYGLIKDDPVCSARSGKKGRKQAHPAFQLAVLLKYLGTEGSGNSNPDLRNQFRIGRGTTKLWRDRARVAVRRLRNQALTWPDDSERAVISKRIFEQYDWPNCIGIMDGTLFPLAFEPQTEDAPDYHGRKFAYSITCLIICDDQRRVRYFHCGWPGSTHDERVFRNCQISKDPDKWLSPTQYILGDTAYENDWYVLSSFRKPAGGIMPHEQEVFNSAMKTLRVVSEHTIGILKGRFPFLRTIRMVIKDDGGKSIRKMCEYVEAAIILHNLLVEQKDEVPDQWVDSDDLSDMEDPNRGMSAAEIADLHSPVPPNAPRDLRRQQMAGYHSTRHVLR